VINIIMGFRDMGCYKSVIVSLIYYFGEELSNSPKDMLYLALIY
jgi:hypothetical protein